MTTNLIKSLLLLFILSSCAPEERNNNNSDFSTENNNNNNKAVEDNNDSNNTQSCLSSDSTSSTDSSTCKCSAGYYAQEKLCIICPQGNSCNNSIKTACKIGDHQDKAGQNKCNQCPLNTYSDEEGQATCINIVTSRSCTSHDKITCSSKKVGTNSQLCLAGYDGKKCLPVGTNYYRAYDPKKLTRTTDLPLGYYGKKGYSRNIFALETEGTKYALLKNLKIKSSAANNVEATKIKDAIEVSAGDNYFCVLLYDGKLKCHGTNTNIPPTNNLVNISQISSAKNHTCVLIDKQVWCGGSNLYGQLGNDTNFTKTGQNPFTKVANITAKKVFTGETQSCAIIEDDSLSCWGHRTKINTIREQVETNVKQASIGYDHICVVTNDHLVQCRGTQSNKLGKQPTNILAKEPVRQVLARKDYSCALLFSGQVKCWGNLKIKILGSSSTKNLINTSSPITIIQFNKKGTYKHNETFDSIIALTGNENDICVIYHKGLKQWASCLSEELASNNSFTSKLEQLAPVHVGAQTGTYCISPYYCDNGLRFTALPGYYVPLSHYMICGRNNHIVNGSCKPCQKDNPRCPEEVNKYRTEPYKCTFPKPSTTGHFGIEEWIVKAAKETHFSLKLIFTPEDALSDLMLSLKSAHTDSLCNK
jgi:hypothetical protein